MRGRSRWDGAHRRIRRRAHEVRRRPWKVAAGVVAVLALVAGVVFLVGYSRVFVARDVVVTGVSGEQVQEIVADAGVPSGRPLARIDTAAVEERVLSDPRVAQAQVGRLWPSTVSIDVRLREPALVVSAPEREMQLADDAGVVYQAVPEAPEGLPQVRVPEGAQVKPELLTGALALVESLSPQVRDGMSALQVDARSELRFDHGDVRVLWGAPGQDALKSRVLDALLGQRGVREAPGEVIIDLSVPATPVVTGMIEEETST